MRFKLLGNSGLRVSELSLGTMTFGEDWGWGSSRDVSKKIFDAYAEAGGNFLDTADGYTGGTSEKMLGEFLHGQREKFVLATKFSFNARGGDPNAGGNHRKNMVQALEGSLRRLKMEYVDLYWMHAWDQLTPMEEVMRGLDDLVRAGKVLYVGVSDAPAWWISRANMLAELRGWTPFVALQIEYSLIERTVERDLLPMADALNMSVAAWSPLASGVLTGKYGKGSGGSDEKRLDKASFVELSERNLRIAETVAAVAKKIGRSSAQVALAWTRLRPNVIPILGARKLDQFLDNMGCLDLVLGEDDRRRLDEVSKVDMGFPNAFLERKTVRDFLHGGTWEQIDK
jgi:aryl-alcohol dehydrogenase-like predicted oxidoreductase